MWCVVRVELCLVSFLVVIAAIVVGFAPSDYWPRFL